MHLPNPARRLAAALALLLSAVSLPLCAQGGPPMLTDDPGTPGNGSWELNVALTAEAQHGARALEAPLLDLNYGVGERIQLKVEGPWLVLDAPDETRSGLGDLAVGVKWRFVDQQGARLANVSVYPQVAARTLLEGDSAEGGRPLQVLLPLEIAHSFGRASANAEVGYAFGDEASELIAGLVLGWDLGDGAEALAEYHQTSVRTTGENERFADVGVRRMLGTHFTLLASAGHSVGAPTATWIGYLGLQLTS